jgi:hypothetical protein
LNDEDVNDLKEASVILAADVVYDDLITIKFMNTVYKLLTCSSRRQSRCCIVANEKRINFSAMSLSAGDTAYDYFMSCLRDLDGYMDIELGYRFECEEIKTTISSGSEEDHDKLVKYIKNYRRNKFLYIWKITSFPI